MQEKSKKVQGGKCVIDISPGELDQMIADGIVAYEYAWDHYDELFARKPEHILYGAVSTKLGAASPSHLTYTRQRILSSKLRRKEYNAYELDKEFNIIKHYTVLNGKIASYYLHFWLNGIHYARCFYGDKKVNWRNAEHLHAIKYEDGNPVCYAIISESMVVAEFYEFVSAEKMIVTTCFYRPDNEHLSWDAPPDSYMRPLTCGCIERIPQSVDFKRFFL